MTNPRRNASAVFATVVAGSLLMAGCASTTNSVEGSGSDDTNRSAAPANSPSMEKYVDFGAGLTSTRFIPGFNSSTKGLETACHPTALGTASADRRIGEMKTLKNPQYLDVFLASRGRDGKRDHRPYDYWYSWHEDPAAYPLTSAVSGGASTVSGKLVPGVWTEKWPMGVYSPEQMQDQQPAALNLRFNDAGIKTGYEGRAGFEAKLQTEGLIAPAYCSTGAKKTDNPYRIVTRWRTPSVKKEPLESAKVPVSFAGNITDSDRQLSDNATSVVKFSPVAGQLSGLPSLPTLTTKDVRGSVQSGCENARAVYVACGTSRVVTSTNPDLPAILGTTVWTLPLTVQFANITQHPAVVKETGHDSLFATTAKPRTLPGSATDTARPENVGNFDYLRAFDQTSKKAEADVKKLGQDQTNTQLGDFVDNIGVGAKAEYDVYLAQDDTYLATCSEPGAESNPNCGKIHVVVKQESDQGGGNQRIRVQCQRSGELAMSEFKLNCSDAGFLSKRAESLSGGPDGRALIRINLRGSVEKDFDPIQNAVYFNQAPQ